MELNFATGCTVTVNDIHDNQVVNVTCTGDDLTNIEKPQQTSAGIDAEGLKTYFNARFLGLGDNIDFFSSFVENLTHLANNKQAAIVANMVYTSKQMNNRRPATFAAWYKEFCRLTGFKFIEGYRPSTLTPDEQLQHLFSML